MNQTLLEGYIKDAAYLTEEIRKMDLLSGDPNQRDKVDLRERNNLVELLRFVWKRIPLTYKVGDSVIVKFKRPIKGKVVKIDDPEGHYYLIKPFDTVHKHEMILHNDILELDRDQDQQSA